MASAIKLPNQTSEQAERTDARTRFVGEARGAATKVGSCRVKCGDDQGICPFTSDDSP